MSKKYSNILLLVLILFGFAQLLYAEYGKIAGTITDKETGEPLVGVNVIIENTDLGAASDTEGEYYIIKVPPGNYRVRASMMGYRTIIKTDVNVNSNQTVYLNFQLETAPLQFEPVVVEAERPAIIVDKTHSGTIMEAEDITGSPAEGLREIINLSAGIERSDEGGMHVRGGPTDDLRFNVDGVEQKQSISARGAGGTVDNRNWMMDLNPLAVEEMEVIIGGFNAEYGRAQSGVVNVKTKDGSEQFSATTEYEYSPPGKYHWGPYLYNPEAMVEWKRWGDLEDWEEWNSSKPAVQQISQDSLEFLHNKWLENHTPGPGHKGGAYDYRDFSYNRLLLALGGPFGKYMTFYLAGEDRREPTRIPTEQRINNYQNYTLNLALPLGASKLLFNGQYAHLKGGSVGTYQNNINAAGRTGRWKYALVRDNGRDQYVTTQSIKWTSSVSQNTYWDLQFYHQRELFRSIMEHIAGSTDPWWMVSGPWDEGYLRNSISWSIFYEDTRVDEWSMTGNYSTQAGNHHLVKAGGEVKYWDIYTNSTSSGPERWLTSMSFSQYFHGYPYYFGAYVQDKMEYGHMIANVGVRLDGYNVNTSYYENRFNPFYQGTGASGRGDPEKAKPETKYAISPRIGISYPVGEYTAFHFQYGHFHNMPQNRYTLRKQTLYGWNLLGNPAMGFNKTISYEFGLQQNVAGKLRFDVTVFYNDRVNQVTSLMIHAPTGSIRNNRAYSTYENSGYGESKGLEVSVENRRQSSDWRWFYRLTYTFSRTSSGAYGTNEIWSPDPNDSRNFLNQRSANANITGFDRTHKIRMYLTYRVPEKSGINLFNIYPFANSSVRLIYTLNSGRPYTYVTTFDEFRDLSNNRRYPLEGTTDTRFQKRLEMDNFSLNIGIRVNNLFDNQLLNTMSSDVLEDWVEENITRNDKDSPEYKFEYFQTYWNMPRRVYFTLGAEF